MLADLKCTTSGSEIYDRYIEIVSLHLHVGNRKNRACSNTNLFPNLQLLKLLTKLEPDTHTLWLLKDSIQRNNFPNPASQRLLCHIQPTWDGFVGY